MKTYFEANKAGWDDMLDFLTNHPVCGYREARTRTWYPGQALIYTPYATGEGDKDGGFRISGEKFEGARVVEGEGCLELHIDYDGDVVVLDCDEREAVLKTFDDVIEFLESCETVEGDSEEYAGLEINENEITYEFTKYTYPEPKYESINRQNFRSAHIDYNRSEVSILSEWSHITIKFEM